MKYHEITVKIEKEIETFSEARVKNRYVILYLNYHINLCRKK